MSNVLKIRKVASLPAVLEASTMYMVKSADGVLFDMYVSTDDGLAARHLNTKPEIQAMIAEAIAGFSTVSVVANIAARNALAPTVTMQAMVLDATGDATVTSGSATYVYDTSNHVWHKTSESESLDLVLQWANIQGKPTSAVADIDDAVNKRHVHANSSVISALSDVGGQLAYNSQPVRAFLEEESW